MFTIPSDEINVITRLLELVIVSHLGPKGWDTSTISRSPFLASLQVVSDVQSGAPSDTSIVL